MKLLNVLNTINQIEKSSFLKILDNFCLGIDGKNDKVEKILSGNVGQLKNIDNENIVRLFEYFNNSYLTHLKNKIKFNDYQLDVIVDILIRDGNSIMSREWFSKLYSAEIKKLKRNIGKFSSLLLENSKGIDFNRKRDYLIYNDCIKTGWENDLFENRDSILSKDEKSILHTLAQSLDLSNEEIRWITYSIIGVELLNVDKLINELKESGVIFYQKRTNTLFIPEEIVWLLRNSLGIEIAEKHVRRILRNLSNSELNLIIKKHNIEKGLDRENKIKSILKQGLSVKHILTKDIYKDDVLISVRSNRVQKLIKYLEMNIAKTGRSLDEKVINICNYFNQIDKDDTIVLSRDGYSRLLHDLDRLFPNMKKIIKNTFQLQEEDILCPDYLEKYNIRPRDIIYLLTKEQIKTFCTKNNVSKRGNHIENIIENYRNIDDLLIENLNLVGNRDLNSLKEKGLSIKESEIGIIYENLVKKVFVKLGFNVDNRLRNTLNTKRHKIDILLRINEREVIIIECKTIKDRVYNKYSATSRQIKSYQKICENNGLTVLQILLVSNDFSEEFVSECEYDYEMNLSLITSNGLTKILEKYTHSNLGEFPVRLLLKDGLLNEDRIVKMLGR